MSRVQGFISSFLLPSFNGTTHNLFVQLLYIDFIFLLLLLHSGIMARLRATWESINFHWSYFQCFKIGRILQGKFIDSVYPYVSVCG